MSCCRLYLIIGSILLLTFSYAQPPAQHDFLPMNPNWTLEDFPGEYGPWYKEKIRNARATSFRVNPVADCDPAIAAIPDGTLLFDPAADRESFRAIDRTGPKFTAHIPLSARQRRFAIPVAIRHRSCLVLINANRGSGTPLNPSTVTGYKWYRHLYTRVFPMARKLAERMWQGEPYHYLSPPRHMYNTFTTESGLEDGIGHGYQYSVRIMGMLKGSIQWNTVELKTISGAGKVGSNAARRMSFPEEGWQIIIAQPQRHFTPLEQWRDASATRYNLYEAQGTYSGIGTKGLWWVLDAYKR